MAADDRVPQLSEPAKRLRPLYRDVLVGRGVDVARHQPEPRCTDPWADAIDEAQLPDRGVDGLFREELLHFFEDRGALCSVELGRLLRKKRVDIGVAAVAIDAAVDDESL